MNTVITTLVAKFKDGESSEVVYDIHLSSGHSFTGKLLDFNPKTGIVLFEHHNGKAHGMVDVEHIIAVFPSVFA